MPDPAGTAEAMDALAAELRAAGLAVEVHETQGVLDITASLDPPGCKTIEVIADQDGYTEIRFWHQPDAPPPQMAATIMRALAAIATAQRA
jgi:hypothetical protein